MSEHKKFAADTTVEVIKLLITLSVGFLGFSAALVKITIDPEAGFAIEGPYWFLLISWMLILVTIGAGVLALGGLVTNAIDHEKYDVDDSWVAISQIVQQFCFVLSFVSFVVFIVFS